MKIKTNPNQFLGVILTGGTSNRMGGEDKAFLNIDGRPMVSYPKEALLGAKAAEVASIGGDFQKLLEMGIDAHPESFALREDGSSALRQEKGGQDSTNRKNTSVKSMGPLSGVIQGCRLAHQKGFGFMFVLSCDLPLASSETISEIVSAHRKSKADAALPLLKKIPQYLYGSYKTNCLPILEKQFRSGIRSMKKAVESLDVQNIQVSDTATLQDVDTPLEVANIRKQIVGDIKI